jgi:hypothetical protein
MLTGSPRIRRGSKSSRAGYRWRQSSMLARPRNRSPDWGNSSRASSW